MAKSWQIHHVFMAKSWQIHRGKHGKFTGKTCEIHRGKHGKFTGKHGRFTEKYGKFTEKYGKFTGFPRNMANYRIVQEIWQICRKNKVKRVYRVPYRVPECHTGCHTCIGVTTRVSMRIYHENGSILSIKFTKFAEFVKNRVKTPVYPAESRVNAGVPACTFLTFLAFTAKLWPKCPKEWP